MTTFYITAESVPGFLQAKTKEIRQLILDATKSAAVLGVGIVVGKIMSASPFPAVDRGRLHQSVKAHTLRDAGMVETRVKYAAAIDVGTRPFRPPYRPIAGWVQRKMKLPRSFIADAKAFALPRRARGGANGTMFKPIKKRARGENRKRELVRFANIVEGLRTAIATRGIKARNFSLNSVVPMADLVMEEIARRLRSVK